MNKQSEDQKTKLSPGRLFAEACAQHGSKTSLEFDYTITDSLLSSRKKPRIPVRNLFKVIDLSKQKLNYYWYEAKPEESVFQMIHESDLRPEAASQFHINSLPDLYPTTAWVQIDPRLMEDVDSFASFLDLRLIIRLCTAENQALTIGKGGLLTGNQLIDTLPQDGLHPIHSACNQIEQMGGTGDGLIMNPFDYWKFHGQGHFLTDLEEFGIQLVRTRLIPIGSAIIGDFGHGARLLDRGRSIIRFAEPPAGTFSKRGLSIMAEIYERPIINLQTNFFCVKF